ncbi:Demethylrebeccamycin-D-glucose O-methyltransferase [Anaerolineales bacterium]|nr:Demethylrebeccamycin-D-glucose O-methyltransferase [Anaerolineales bacterium]
MQRFTDQQYLTNDQYKDSSNLDARIEIHKQFSTNPYGWFNWIFDDLLKLPADATVLELGCGTGEMWKQCAARIPVDWNITLTDLSDGMLDSAWRNLVVIGRGFKFEKMDAQSISYADKTFDAVIANHMLYHLPDRKQGLKEIKRILKDNGVLFATTVGKNHMQEMHGWIHRVSGGKQGMVTLSFTLENGKEQLQEFFPRVELTRYPDGLRVTDTGMVIKYMRSMVSTGDLLDDELQFLEHELAETMGKNGEISISKDSGLFIARK